LASSLLVCAAAQAQLFRAYLAADGNDANPCTLPAPCRLLPAALNAVADGGEIWMLDSANYNTGTVTIDKAVSILAVPGVVGSIVALNGGPAILIDSTDQPIIALRNVVIGPVAGAAPGTNGVQVNAAATLTIEKSVIANLPGHGVHVKKGATLKVNRTILRNNANFAIRLDDYSRAMVSGSQLLGNAAGGVLAYANYSGQAASVSISDSVISGGNYGVSAYADLSGSTARISVARSTIERTSKALDSEASTGATAEVNFGSSLIADNGQSWYVFGASAKVLSLGNNQLRGNGSPTGVLTPLPPQ
jgi:hypothetical protein